MFIYSIVSFLLMLYNVYDRDMLINCTVSLNFRTNEICILVLISTLICRRANKFSRERLHGRLFGSYEIDRDC